jgi:hypothetical protein
MAEQGAFQWQRAASRTLPALAAGPKPTPHVLWLVQREVDLVDLPSGDGVWRDEEANSCDSRKRAG